MRELSFAKGHGTRNDFVLFTDLDDEIQLSDAEVAFVCDRRAGVGADGTLRVVRGKHIPGWDGDPEILFMDYRNADGSLAEMCGNGLRVFLRYLAQEDLAATAVGTRAGLRSGVFCADGLIEVDMGPVVLGRTLSQTCCGYTFTGRSVDVGNPHLVSFVDGAVLDSLDLSKQPTWDPPGAFPNGVNNEFVEVLGQGQLRMRVYERGSGETMSCGTGIVAAAAAAQAAYWPNDQVSVSVPGGTLQVRLGTTAMLTGPAEIVARGKVWIP
ncbi:MAG: diaminopimelate epimerase [Propionibacteriaceae bacterium]|jgi:diaminopimelate epimerase|nr:diaminopimelate epimerase [Propionibacteriaceae bacterium]